MLRDRQQAGSLLARRLSNLKDKNDVLILGIPRGGVVVAKEISKRLNLPLDILIVRKIGAPHHEELAIGAVGEGGTTYLDDDLISKMGIARKEISRIVKHKKIEVNKRIELFRKEKKQLKIKGKKVIVVDDGIATGSTIKVAIGCLKKRFPRKIILAVPVCPSDTAEVLEKLVDSLITLELPEEFYAVGNFYESFPQVKDDKVVNLLK